MWCLFKAELNYNKYLLLWLFGIYILLYIKVTIVGEIISSLILMLIVTAVVTFGNIIKRNNEKRERHFVLLPVKNRTIGILRFVLIFIFWMTLLLLFWLKHFTVDFQSIGFKIGWILLTINSLVLVSNATLFLQNDLKNIGFIKNTFLNKFIYFLIIFILWLFILGLFNFVLTIIMTNGGEKILNLSNKTLAINIIALNVIGVLMSIFTVFSFERKKSYVG